MRPLDSEQSSRVLRLMTLVFIVGMIIGLLIGRF